MVATLFREGYLLTWFEASKTIPDKKKAVITEVLRTGAFLFLFGFIIWNLDNIFCDSWTRVKLAVGWPAAFFMEGRFASFVRIMPYLTRCSGHAWWHIFTVSLFHFWPVCLNSLLVGQGLGTFYLNQGVTCVSIAFLRHLH
jgi:dihydroceramidase